MNTDYQDLINLIQNEQELSSFFAKEHDYKSILETAIEKEDISIINALNQNLPLRDWFDKDAIFEAFLDTFRTLVFDANKYTWCMTIPELRKCFTPEEKGRFVRMGFALGNHEMSYHGSLDKDWEADVLDRALLVELSRISHNRVKNFDGEHLQEKYLKWMRTEILCKVSEKDQYLFLFGALDIAITDLRQIAELRSLADLDLLPGKSPSSENIYNVEKDLKDCIKYLKHELYFDLWPSSFKFEFNYFATSSLLANNKDIEREKLQEFAEKLIPIAEYAKLNSELSNTNIVNNKKCKM
jgi:hypothetical protein